MSGVFSTSIITWHCANVNTKSTFARRSLNIVTLLATGIVLWVQQKLICFLWQACQDFSRDARAMATCFQKWPEALPIFDHGHFHKLRLFADGKIEEPKSKLVFAGDYLGGPFMEGAFTSGMQAADRLHAQLR